MFVHDRHRQIVDRLSRRPRITVTQLQKEIRVSRSTLRRDLLELEEQGDIVRVHGGVVHRDHLQGEPTFTRRGKQAVAAKREIAAVAAEMVSENASVYLDAGTTCFEIGRLVLLRPDIKVFTHSLRLAADASVSDALANIVLIGGEVRKVSQAVVGGMSLDWLNHLRFDIAFVAASGVHSEGASTTELSESAVKQAIIARSAKTVLVADASKWDHPAAVRFAALSEFDLWVVDRALTSDARQAAKEAGLHVISAKKKAAGAG